MNAGFPKIKVSGTGSFTPPTPIPLTPDCPLGSYVYWDNIMQQRTVGILKEWDSNVAVIQLDNGSIKAVET